MTYNEWRDELKNNLLSVSDGERRRVLDYYAEAYADRREAGFTEREIIQDFGAPYDAAQRILCENDEETYEDAPKYAQYDDSRESRHNARREERCANRCDRRRRDDYYEPEQNYRYEPQPQSQGNTKTAKRGDYTWVFVLLCVIFAIPIFCIVMTMIGVTIGLCVAPFGMMINGIVRVCTGIGALFTNLNGGFISIGLGLVQLGVGLVVIPLFIWLVKLMWKLFRKFFAWIKQLFSGKESA